MGVNAISGKWERQRSYGGKLFENVCQKFARNVMAHNMQAIDEAGYEIVLSVHDELITEAPDKPKYNEKALSEMLSKNVIWSSGMPLAAAGFEAYAYRKD